MTGLLLDTHATIWYLEASLRLSSTALTAIQSCLNNGEPVYISTVTVVELTYLVEKGRFPVTLLDQLLAELRQPTPELIVAPLDLAMVDVIRKIAVRDMPDRMIAASAVALGVPLVTRDQQIQGSSIAVIW